MAKSPLDHSPAPPCAHAEHGPQGERAALVWEQWRIGGNDDDDGSGALERGRGGKGTRSGPMSRPTGAPFTTSRMRVPWLAWTGAADHACARHTGRRADAALEPWQIIPVPRRRSLPPPDRLRRLSAAFVLGTHVKAVHVVEEAVPRLRDDRPAPRAAMACHRGCDEGFVHGADGMRVVSAIGDVRNPDSCIHWISVTSPLPLRPKGAAKAGN